MAPGSWRTALIVSMNIYYTSISANEDNTLDHPQRWLDLAAQDVVAVVPNYRLGLFGFLAGDQVRRDGDLNVGLLDQQFALPWVQQHIHKFGGDKKKVTIWGQSAGGGSVMQHVISNPEFRGNKELFVNAVANSPFLPSQYAYDHEIPTKRYQTVMKKTGCGRPYSGESGLACLRKLPTSVLARANLEIAAMGHFGTSTWNPVIEPEGGFIDTRPTVALLGDVRPLNGHYVLTTHIAWEGQLLVDASVVISNLTTYLSGFKPTLSTSQTQRLISLYPLSRYVSEYQRTQSIYQDTVFFCPSYWLAEAFSGAAYKGIWNLPPAIHSQDAEYWFFKKDYRTLPSPETFENYVGAIVCFIRSGGDANRYRLNKRKGKTNERRWPWFETSRRKGLVFDLAQDGKGSKIELETQDKGLTNRCEWWRSVGNVTGQ
ncbi:Alpha/Beta hydrolase protein [Kalaharituber pfeilii]|nr:Alpha/Beta hydrolase protein [Kalaharituber pfeilii]